MCVQYLASVEPEFCLASRVAEKNSAPSPSSSRLLSMLDCAAAFPAPWSLSLSLSLSLFAFLSGHTQSLTLSFSW